VTKTASLGCQFEVVASEAVPALITELLSISRERTWPFRITGRLGSGVALPVLSPLEGELSVPENDNYLLLTISLDGVRR
jgi:hypothetical protein